MWEFKECSSCEALYTKSCACSKGGFIDMFVCKTPYSSQRPPYDCPRCGSPVDGIYCRHCALLQKKLKEVWFIICDEHKFFQDFLNTSESSNEDSNVVNMPQDPIVFNQYPGENSSQSPPHIDHHCCYGCGNSLDDIFCQRCTCKPCGKDENSFAYDSTPNLVKDSPNIFNPHSQPPMYSYEFYGDDAHYSYDFPHQVPFIYDPEPCYNQDFNFLQNFQNFQQQYPGCKNCGGPHETFQCQQVIFYDPCCENCGVLTRLFNRDIIISELPLYIAITPVLSTKETKDSLIMGDGHLDTIPKKESDEFIKSSVQNLVPNPSEFEDESECDVPACDDFTTFSNLLFDADDDFSSSDNESFSNEDIPKEIYLNPLFDEEIIPIKIDPCHFNVESDLIDTLLNQDSSIIYSSKIDFLLDEFAGELIFLKSIPPGIDEADCDPKEEIRLIKKLLYDNSSPHPPKEFIFENSDASIESFSPSSIRVEDSDSLMEEIDLPFTLDDSMPLGIEDDDYESERDILILEELLSNYSLLLPENESFHFDIPSSPRPPAKPPDDDEIEPNLGILTIKVDDDYESERDILILEELLSNYSLLLPENESFHFDIPSSPRPPAKPPDDDEIEPNLGILTIKVEFLDFKDSCKVLSFSLQLPQLHLGIKYPNLID
nr:hypothetical protein [Tanacetum cinerariifolium]